MLTHLHPSVHPCIHPSIHPRSFSGNVETNIYIAEAREPHAKHDDHGKGLTQVRGSKICCIVPMCEYRQVLRWSITTTSINVKSRLNLLLTVKQTNRRNCHFHVARRFAADKRRTTSSRKIVPFAFAPIMTFIRSASGILVTDHARLDLKRPTTLDWDAR